VTPPPLSRSINVTVVLLLCAVIVAARLLLSHAQTETGPTPIAAATPVKHPHELLPVW
jgi:hypothetical protein